VLFLGAGVAGFVSVRWYVRKHGYCVCEPCLVSVSGCFHLFWRCLFIFDVCCWFRIFWFNFMFVWKKKLAKILTLLFVTCYFLPDKDLRNLEDLRSDLHKNKCGIVLFWVSLTTSPLPPVDGKGPSRWSFEVFVFEIRSFSSSSSCSLLSVCSFFRQDFLKCQASRQKENQQLLKN
jgi:hypothetical protein